MISEEIMEKLFVNGKFNGMKFKHFVSKETIQELEKNYRSFQEGVYCIKNKTAPQKCLVCNNKSNFISISKGYGKYCSARCTASRDHSKDIKIILTVPANNDNSYYELDEAIKKIKEIILDVNGNVSSTKSYEKIANIDIKLYNSLFFYTKSFLKDNAKVSQRVYHIVNRIWAVATCKMCSKEINFGTTKVPYNTYCSTFCTGKDVDLQNTRMKTKDEKNPNWRKDWSSIGMKTYENKTGFKHNMHNPEVIRKINESKLKKYGDNYSKVIIQKSFTTYKNKTGFNTPFNNPEITRFTQHRRVINKALISAKRIEKRKKKYENTNPQPKKHICNAEYLYNKKYIEDNFLFSDKSLDVNSMKKFFNCGSGWCFVILTRLNIEYKKSRSRLEQNFLQKLQELNLTFKQNNRSIIKGIEIDFFIESKLCVEINGIFTHSFGKSKYSFGNNLHVENKNYHKNKTDKCAEENLDLFHFIENDLYNKTAICLSHVKDLLNLNKKIDINLLEKKQISKELFKQFINKNSLLKYSESDTHYALFDNNNRVIFCYSVKDDFIYNITSAVDISITGSLANILDRSYSYKHDRRYPSSFLKQYEITSALEPEHVYIKQLKNNQVEIKDSNNEKEMFDKHFRRIWDSGYSILLIK